MCLYRTINGMQSQFAEGKKRARVTIHCERMTVRENFLRMVRRFLRSVVRVPSMSVMKPDAFSGCALSKCQKKEKNLVIITKMAKGIDFYVKINYHGFNVHGHETGRKKGEWHAVHRR